MTKANPAGHQSIARKIVDQFKTPAAFVSFTNELQRNALASALQRETAGFLTRPGLGKPEAKAGAVMDVSFLLTLLHDGVVAPWLTGGAENVAESLGAVTDLGLPQAIQDCQTDLLAGFAIANDANAVQPEEVTAYYNSVAFLLAVANELSLIGEAQPLKVA